jgi:hypothetical protein
MTDNAVQALATYRLEHDLSFDQLAAQMSGAGYAIRARALHLLLTNRVRTQPRERTIYKIRQFLANVADPKKPRRRAAQRRRARSNGGASAPSPRSS